MVVMLLHDTVNAHFNANANDKNVKCTVWIPYREKERESERDERKSQSIFNSHFTKYFKTMDRVAINLRRKIIYGTKYGTMYGYTLYGTRKFPLKQSVLIFVCEHHNSSSPTSSTIQWKSLAQANDDHRIKEINHFKLQTKTHFICACLFVCLVFWNRYENTVERRGENSKQYNNKNN